MSSGRKRTTDRHYSAEDQALDQISKEAEERIQARRQARAEAREIRLKEIERQQREEEERQKAQQQGLDTSKSVSSYSGSRRGSNDSTESDVSSKDSKDPKDQVRQIKNELRELQEKFKAAMVTNAQLDNVKTSHVFQLELLKEQIEEQEEAFIEVQREYKDKCRDFELLKRDFEALKLENEGIKHQMEVKDKLLKESGLVIITTEEGEFSLTKCANLEDVTIPELGSAVISEEAADLLKRAGEGTLGKPDSGVKVTVLDSHVASDNTGLFGTVHCSDKNVDLFQSVSEEGVLKRDGFVKETEDLLTNNVNSCDGNEVKLEGLQQVESDNVKDVEAGFNREKEDVDKRKSDSDSESDVFYESKSEFTPTVTEFGKVERVSDADFGVQERSKTEEQVKTESRMSNVEIQVFDDNAECLDAVVPAESVEVKEKAEFHLVKMGGKRLDVRKIIGSESCISMESDVTYHSESEDLELFEDTIIDYTKPVVASSEITTSKDFEDVKIERGERDSVSEPILDDFNGLRLSEEVDFSQIEDGFVHNQFIESVLEEGDIKDDSSVVKNVDAALSSVDTNQNDERSRTDAMIMESENGYQIGTKKSSPVVQFDEVFMSVPVSSCGRDECMKDFVRNYIKDVVMKSMDIYNMELANNKDKITVRKMSYSKENIDISVSKQHYSEELMETATSVFPKKLSSGSVEILSPIVSIPSDTKGDLKFFSYKVDTGADIVLTSIEEEQQSSAGHIQFDPVLSDSINSPVSGFGVYYTSLTENNSDLDSDDEAGEGDSEIDTENIEFSAMHVELESKNNVSDVNITREVGEISNQSQDLENDTVTRNSDEKMIKAEKDLEKHDKVVQEQASEDGSCESVGLNVCDADELGKSKEKGLQADAEEITKSDLTGTENIPKEEIGDIQQHMEEEPQQLETDHGQDGQDKVQQQNETGKVTDDTVENRESNTECTAAVNEEGGSDEAFGSVSASLDQEGYCHPVDSDRLQTKKSKKKSTKQKTKDDKKQSKDEKKLTKDEKRLSKEEKVSAKEEKKNSKEECVVS